MKTIAVIPARYASTRYPGKPLLRETGKYLIQHVYEQVRQVRSISEVCVATDDDRIADAVRSFGGTVVMTRADHPTGTDRVAEVAASHDCELVINVQGDEPEIEPGNIDKLVQLMATDKDVSIGTLACPFRDDADPADSNAVKVVVDKRGRALYFSRALIPYPRDDRGQVRRPGDWLLHLGIYAYRRKFLLKLATLQPTAMEQTEKLEQLRAMEHGYAFGVGIVAKAPVGIDTPEDYAAFVRRWKSRSA